MQEEAAVRRAQCGKPLPADAERRGLVPLRGKQMVHEWSKTIGSIIPGTLATVAYIVIVTIPGRLGPRTILGGGGGGQSYDLYRNSPAYIMYHKLQWTSVNARKCQGNCIDWRIGTIEHTQMLVPHETACTLTSRLTFYSKATTRSGDTMHTSAYYYCTILFWV